MGEVRKGKVGVPRFVAQNKFRGGRGHPHSRRSILLNPGDDASMEDEDHDDLMSVEGRKVGERSIVRFQLSRPGTRRCKHWNRRLTDLSRPFCTYFRP